MGRSNLRNSLRDTFMKQFAAGKEAERAGQGHYWQKEHGNSAAYDYIWSQNSQKTLLNSAERIAKIAKTVGVKHITEQNWEDATNKIIKAEEKAGYSSGTLSQDIRALNHYLVGNHTIEQEKRLTRAKFGFEARSSEIAKQRYKSLNSAEWEKENPSDYQRWHDPIELIRATGLRRSEMESFKVVQVEDNLEVLTIGKNGKIRFAEVMPGREQEVINYSHAESIPKIDQSQANQIVNSKNLAQSWLKDGQSVHVSSHIPTHIHRARYAQDLVQKLSTKDYSDEKPYISRRGVEHETTENYTVGEFTAPYGAWIEVSQSLGHNRLEIMKNYCGIGR